MRLSLLLVIIGVVVLAGCVSSTNVSSTNYVCSDGSTVSNPQDCPQSTNASSSVSATSNSDSEANANSNGNTHPQTTNSRANPSPIGTPLISNFDLFCGTGSAKITVTDIKRGSAAWSMIEEASMVNEAPKPDKDYILAKIKFELISMEDDDAFDATHYEFDVVSESGRVYNEWGSIVEPDPQFGTSLYPGSAQEGWMAFEVDSSDSKPVLAFEREEDGEVWLALYGEEVTSSDDLNNVEVTGDYESTKHTIDKTVASDEFKFTVKYAGFDGDDYKIEFDVKNIRNKTWYFRPRSILILDSDKHQYDVSPCFSCEVDTYSSTLLPGATKSGSWTFKNIPKDSGTGTFRFKGGGFLQDEFEFSVPLN